MNRNIRKAWVVAAALLVAAIVGCQEWQHERTAKLTVAPAATEGMWLPNALPLEHLKNQFGFEPTPQWIEHLRLASVHLGASGAFVSSDGLVLTNHHVASGGLQSISRPGKDYVADGFLAKTRDEEIQLPGADLRVLESIQDVTERVRSAVSANATSEQAVKARNAAIAEIERDAQQRTGLQCSVVTLYGGAQYHLYRYKRYSDVRIVFAPEVATGFFGGDPDNFEYPRFCLDIALLRAYENGRPARTDHYLKLSPAGVQQGDLVFVSGHPARTDRLLPPAMLEGMRDQNLPLRIEGWERREKALLAYSQRSDEARRQAQEEIFSIQNSLKAFRPRLAALKGNVLTQKAADERAFRTALRARDDLRRYDQAWDLVGRAEAQRTALQLRQSMLENGQAFSSSLFWYARQLVRLSAEDAKPDGQRLPEYTQSRRESLEIDLFADEPIYSEMEIATLTASLQFFQEKLGNNSADVKQVLAGKTPEARAVELVRGTKLAAPDQRRRIRDGGAAAIASSDDPLIQLARSIDDESRAMRLAYESQVQEPETRATTDINAARFALLGNATYPDATSTLRLSYGIVRGYQQDDRQIPAWTTLGGAFEHEREHGAAWPYKLPPSWTQARDRLALQTPLNFVCTADITGGNSGSPIVNRAGELVGVIFDSNRQGVASNFAYSDTQARAVAVDSRAILEALDKIYHADTLLKELAAGSSR